MHYAYFTTMDLDCSRGMGMELDRQFNIKEKLHDPHYRNLHFFDEDTHNIDIGSVILIDNTLGLVARYNIGEMLTMESIKLCLENLYQVCNRHYISSIILEDPSWYNPGTTSEMVYKYILKSIGLQNRLKITIRGVGSNEFNNGYGMCDTNYNHD